MNNAPIDFLQNPREPWVGWLLLGFGSLALGAAVLTQHKWSAEQDGILVAEREAATAYRASRIALPRAEPTLAERRMQQAQLELSRPWLPALRTIEEATFDPVFLLSLTIEPVSGLVKLEAEAPSFDYALAYVQLLDDAVLRGATLISHEQTQDLSGGRRNIKFGVTARWEHSPSIQK